LQKVAASLGRLALDGSGCVSEVRLCDVFCRLGIEKEAAHDAIRLSGSRDSHGCVDVSRFVAWLVGPGGGAVKDSSGTALEGDEPDDSLCHPHRGVSVHHLATSLRCQMREAGLSPDASIYDIEPVIIRPKGARQICPRTRKLGAAYVDSIRGKDHAGPAGFMLSYTWGYQVEDIISTLTAYCESRGLSFKAAYCWMCCFCINQHRVQEARQSGEAVPFAAFRAEFGERVRGIGHVVAMMAPWRAPSYIQRVWCVYEVFTAFEEGCRTTICMPPGEASSLADALVDWTGVSAVWQTLAGVRIEHAQASVEEDRRRILQLVAEGAGCTRLNRRVARLLQGWILAEAMSVCQGLHGRKSGGWLGLEELGRGAAVSANVASLCLQLGQIPDCRRALDLGMQFASEAPHVDDFELRLILGRCHGTAGDHREALLTFTALEEAVCKSGDGSPVRRLLLARARRNKGQAHANLCEDAAAHDCFASALETLGADPKTAPDGAGGSIARGESLSRGTHELLSSSLHRSIGAVHLNAGRTKDACLCFSRSCEILAAAELQFTQQCAWAERCMGEALLRLGRGEEALVHCQRAQNVTMAGSLGAAWVHRSTGRILTSLGQWTAAAKELGQAWHIMEANGAESSIEAQGALRDLYALGLAWLAAGRAAGSAPSLGMVIGSVTSLLRSAATSESDSGSARPSPQALDGITSGIRKFQESGELDQPYRIPFGYSD